MSGHSIGRVSAAVLVFVFAATCATAAPRVLTIEDRVAAQKAIEQVYWAHRIWPTDNPGAKPPLEQVMPDSAIQAKVEDYLRKSNALGAVWNRAITSHQLQEEIERMAGSTRDGAMLGELFDALGNDPALIAECLARPALVDRLTRESFASDAGLQGAARKLSADGLAALHGQPLRPVEGAAFATITQRLRRDGVAAEDGRSGTAVALEPATWRQALTEHRQVFGDALAVGSRSAPFESEDAIRVFEIVARTTDSITTVSLSWPKPDFDTWWAGQRNAMGTDIVLPSTTYTAATPNAVSCTDDTWSSLKSDFPDGLSKAAAVWTGTEMLVWGGVDRAINNPEVPSAAGFRYNPATDTWTRMSATGVPEARDRHVAVWTGTELFVWGGWKQAVGQINTGGRYNPSTDSWVATSTGANVPSARDGSTAVWTGSRVIVWGGGNSLNTGGLYDPTTDTWQPTQTLNVEGRRDHVAVWTGSKMIIWGGRSRRGPRPIPEVDTIPRPIRGTAPH